MFKTFKKLCLPLRFWFVYLPIFHSFHTWISPKIKQFCQKSYEILRDFFPKIFNKLTIFFFNSAWDQEDWPHKFQAKFGLCVWHIYLALAIVQKKSALPNTPFGNLVIFFGVGYVIQSVNICMEMYSIYCFSIFYKY